MRLRLVVGALLTAALMAAALLSPAQASNDLYDKQSEIESQVADAHDDLAASSKRLAAAAKALEESKAELPGARAAYEQASAKLDAARERLAAIRQKLRELRAVQRRVRAQIAEAQLRIAETEKTMGRIASAQYQSGGAEELILILDAESPADLVQRYLLTQQVLEMQSKAVDQLAADQAVLAARQQELIVTQQGIEDAEAEALEQVERMESLATEAREAKERIEALVAQRAQALRVAEQERAAERRRLNDLKAAQDAIEAQIAAATAVSSGGPIPKGELRWPTSGPMVGGVGWRVHPVYGYRSCHTGIDISAGSGTPIVAARAGRVVWTQPADGGPYGNNTLVDHGNGLATFYAHQTSFAVSAGQRVSAGQLIGSVGSTGYSTGPHLHFEVHVNGVPYDPMGWFGGAKTPKGSFCP